MIQKTRISRPHSYKAASYTNSSGTICVLGECRGWENPRYLVMPRSLMRPAMLLDFRLTRPMLDCEKTVQRLIGRWIAPQYSNPRWDLSDWGPRGDVTQGQIRGNDCFLNPSVRWKRLWEWSRHRLLVAVIDNWLLIRHRAEHRLTLADMLNGNGVVS